MDENITHRIKLAILRKMIRQNGDYPSGSLDNIANRFELAWRDGSFRLVLKG